MKRVLILGGAGMLGHKLCQILGPSFETYATFRARVPVVGQGVFDRIHPIEGVSADDFASVQSAIRRANPAYVINAIGLIKQRPEAKQAIPSIMLNAVFPHQVAALCRNASIRLVQISTDCVFSGLRGAYLESDLPDPTDLYGRSKLLGEIDDGLALTIRTSIIGRELVAGLGLVEWFLSQAGGRVSGYANAIYSGLTTNALSNIIGRIVDGGSLHGLWHVSSQTISKYDLLCRLDRAFATHTTIDRDEHFYSDHSLISDRFWKSTGYLRPTWDEMIRVLIEDPTSYSAKGASTVD